MSARPGGRGGAGTRGGGKPGGVGEDTLYDENGTALTDEDAATLTIPDGNLGGTPRPGSRGGSTPRPSGKP